MIKGRKNLNNKLKSIRTKYQDNKATTFLTKYLRNFWLYLIGFSFVIVSVFLIFNKNIDIEAATFGWLQTTWSGGASSTAIASHNSDQSGWAFFNSKSANLNTDNNELKIAMVDGAVRVQA